MKRHVPGGAARRSRLGRAQHLGRRAWPVILMAWERWQALPEDEKERYRRRAREYATRGRKAVEQARSKRRGPMNRHSGRRSSADGDPGAEAPGDISPFKRSQRT